jgi:hypothetical protein
MIKKINYSYFLRVSLLFLIIFFFPCGNIFASSASGEKKDFIMEHVSDSHT